MPPVFGASGEPGGWMTVKDEGREGRMVRERGESEEARTEGLICCRRREGGRCVCVRKLNELTTAVGE